MPYANSTRFLTFCIECDAVRLIKDKRPRHSGLCRSCAAKRPLHSMPGSPYPAEAVQRFWSYIDKESSSEGCWLWQGNLGGRGYGTYTFRTLDGMSHTMAAHRFAYQASYGILPSTVFVLHQPPCTERRCVRHLYTGTRQENTNDAKDMKRYATGDRHGTSLHPESVRRKEQHPLWKNHPNVKRGEESGQAKLTNTQVATLRSLYATGNFTQPQLARMFSIHSVYVWKIVTFRTRKNG